MTRQADALSGEGDIFQMHEFYRTGDEIEDLAEFDLFASMDPAKEVGGDFYDAR